MELDKLNFNVIINDEDFNKQIKEMEDEAKRFNTSMSSLLDLKKQAQQWSQKDVENNRRAWQAKVDEERAQEKINKEKIKTEGLQRKINAQIDQATNGYKSQSRILKEIKTTILGYLSIQSASKLLSSLVRVTGEFELQKTTLAAMLGDLNSAEQVITRIQGLAVESPFQFKELTTYAKQLSAFSVPAQELYDTTKMLADISAGLGVGMDRIVLAYGQVRSAAFLRGQEVRQFTEAGIPILDELAKQFSELEGRAVSAGEVFDKISARLVPFEMVAKVFKDMTSEGGKFYNMQEVQAETLKGKISNLKDAYEVMLNEIGKNQSEKLKGAVDWARILMKNYEETGKTLVALVSSYGLYKTSLIGIEIATGTFTTKNHKLLDSLKKIGIWMGKNPYALIAAGIAAIGFATYKWATYLSDVEKIQKAVTDSHNKFAKELASEEAMLNSLYAKLELATEGTLEYDKAKAAILRKYSPYIEQLKEEGIAVDNLADIYVNLADKIRESLQARNYDAAIQSLDEVFKDVESKAQKMLENSIKANAKEYGFTETDKLSLNLYISGAIDKDKAFSKMSDSAKKYFNDFNVFLEKQRKNMEDAKKEYIDGIDEISDAYQTFQSEVENTPEKLSKFAETVQKELSKFGVTEDNKDKFAALWADNMTEYYAYLKKIREEYEDVQQKIKDVGTTQKANLPDLKKQKEAIEAIAKALGISLDKGEYGKGKPKVQKAIEEQIKSVQKLQDAYEKLLPFLDEVQMRSTLKSLFPNVGQAVIDSLDFNAELERLADRLEEFDEDAAQRLRDSVSKDVAGAIAESFNAVEQYKKMLDSWLGEDFNIVGEGTAFDISKILANLNTEYAKIDQKRQRALDLLNKAQLGDELALAKVRETYGEEVWQKYLERGKEVINELAFKERESARKTANEKIRDLADKDLKERVQKANINLTEFDDKTIKQVEDAENRLFALRNQLRNELEDLKANGVTEDEVANIQRLEAEVAQASALIEKTGEELDKKLYDNAQAAMDAISGLGSSISELGDAIGNAKLERFGKDMAETASLASELIDAFESKDTIAIISNIANAVISQITNIVSAAYKEQSRLNDAAREYAEIMQGIRRDAYSSMFGTDEMGLAEENQKILEETRKEYDKVLGKFQNEKQWRREDYFNRITMKNISVADVINNIADSQGWEIYKANGELNIDALTSYYDAYAEHLTSKQKEVVDALIASYEAQNDAAKASAEYMISLFSSAADSIAESMVNAFIESGSAATDLRGIVSDVASQMASDLIKSLYIMPILNGYAKELEAISANDQLTADQKTVQALAILQTGVEKIKDNENAINATLAELEPYFSKGDETGKEFGEGIKGITEDQANLLASYLNAIRADVSYSRVLWVKMDANLQRIAEMFSSSPTLMEYQAQIAANTYNTAIATQEILSELRSVVTTESGASSIRVYKDN